MELSILYFGKSLAIGVLRERDEGKLPTAMSPQVLCKLNVYCVQGHDHDVRAYCFFCTTTS